MGTFYSVSKRLQLAHERGIVVDQQDQWLLENFTWSVDNHGYAYTSFMGAPMKLHHCIIGHPIWEGDTIDHVDRNKSNYSRSNLRYASYYENRMNRIDVDDAYLVRPINKGGFVFTVTRNGVRHTEYFQTEEEAIASRDKWMAKQEQ